MSFDQSTIQDVATSTDDANLRISWTSTAPDGTFFQVYLDRQLAWVGQLRSVVVPHPVRPVWIDVGAVDAASIGTDYGALLMLPLPPGGGKRISLSWPGGLYLGAGLAGFHVYLGDSPGAAVDYSAIVDTVIAYTAPVLTFGFGVGGFGLGGFGSAGNTYTWLSNPVSAGTWHVGIKPFDTAGNEGAAITATVVIAGPPQPPARNAAGKRITYVYHAGTQSPLGYGVPPYGYLGYGAGVLGAGPTITLSWGASPGF